MNRRIFSNLPLLVSVALGGLVVAVGFLPIAVNVDVGGEFHRRLETVVIGGTFTNTLLTLLVLPALYLAMQRNRGLLDSTQG